MKDIKAWDWYRIFFGDAPPEFLLEVFVRTLIVYIVLLVIVRLIGKRINAQISVIELCVMITLGAIVSPGMQIPDRAVAYVVVALTIIFFLHTIINRYGVRKEEFAKKVEGSMEILVKDGIIQLDTLNRLSITRQELFSQLRNKNVENLATVERVYLEGCGLFSVFKTEKNKPGLLVFPEQDKHIFSYKERVDHGLQACANCGHVQNTSSGNDHCEICKLNDWIDAFL